MNKILLATANRNKILEINSILKDIPDLRILSIHDFGIKPLISEDKNTLDENSYKKALDIYNIFRIPAVSDDTGLFVDALNGEPGVHSARYAGKSASYSDNCNKLLLNLREIPPESRTARFETVICFYPDNKLFRGICKGKIINEPRGKNGFGYDPIFIPEGYEKTFAELSDSEKNKISHRSKALQELKKYLIS